MWVSGRRRSAFTERLRPTRVAAYARRSVMVPRMVA
jgi:hypothetical protein